MKLTNIDMSILIGLLLGDGYIDPKGRIYVEHGDKQKDYCIYKASLLHSVCGGKDIKVHEYERRRSKLKNGKLFKSDTFITYKFHKQSKSFIPIRELLYINNKKTITKEILNFLTPLSIALWYLDDGCTTKKHNKGYSTPHYMFRLATYLSKEENDLIQEYFKENYNMLWNVVPADRDHNNKYMLRCGEREGIKFINIIKDIVLEKIPSMSYKVIIDKSAKSLLHNKENDIV